MPGAGARAWLPALLLLGTACTGTEAPLEPRAASQDWTQRWGSSGDDFARALATAPDGAVLVTGYTDGGFDGATNGGEWDGFLTRFEADGSRTWSSQWGGEGPEFAQAVVLDDAGQIFVAGYAPGSVDGQPTLGGHDAFLTRFDAHGEYEWTKQWGTDADDYVYAAAPAARGVVVVGYTQGAFEGFANAGGADAFVSMCDASGSVRWTRQFGSDATDYAQAVHIDAAGHILVAGYTAGKLGDDPDLGAEDAFLLQLDQDGRLGWLRQWGSETTDYALSVTADASGHTYVGGYTYGAMTEASPGGGEDAYLTKLDGDGTLLWTRQLGTPSRDSARFVTLDSDLAPVLGGDTEGSLAAEHAGGRDAFLVRFDAAGSETLREQWGGSDSELSLAGEGVGHSLYVAGYVEGADEARDAWLSKWSAF